MRGRHRTGVQVVHHRNLATVGDQAAPLRASYDLRQTLDRRQQRISVVERDNRPAEGHVVAKQCAGGIEIPDVQSSK